MKGTVGDFGPHQLSDGTLRFVLLATLLSQPADRLPTIIAIDEPELGLHPAALNLIASLIRVAAHHCQVIVATQSAALVDEFEPADVIVVHRHDDGSKLERLSSESLQEWLISNTRLDSFGKKMWLVEGRLHEAALSDSRRPNRSNT